ncbi:MAG: tetratricopeptide repeat protein [Treponemataceae bacterium]|nr:MAG: tetratricopeptide repeat protein [Treponemataceae bacterium]
MRLRLKVRLKSSCMKNPLDSVVFLSLPKHFHLAHGEFDLNPEIPLPVQKPYLGSLPQDSSAEDSSIEDSSAFTVQDIKPEMIFAGILTVLSFDAENAHCPYYRDILLKARPAIQTELATAAYVKMQAKEYALAEEIYTALAGITPGNAAVMLSLAVLFDVQEKNDKAEYFYKEAMDAEPPLANAFFNAGFFYFKQNDFSSAKDCLETYLSLATDFSPDFTSDSGQNGENSGAIINGASFDEQDESSIDEKIEKATELLAEIEQCNLSGERFKKAYSLIASGSEEAGMEEIREFLQENPKVWRAWFLLGWALRKTERWTDAQAAFLEALQNGGSNPDTLNELSICAMENADYEGAQKYLEDALALDAANTKIMSNMGCLLLKTGRSSEAKSWFEAVLAFEPNDAIASKILSELA